MHAGGRGGRGRPLLCEGHTPTCPWKGPWGSLSKGVPQQGGSYDRSRLFLSGGGSRPREGGVSGSGHCPLRPEVPSAGGKGQQLPPVALCPAPPTMFWSGKRLVLGPPSLPPAVLSAPSQSLCLHISVVTWSSLAKAERRGVAVCWRRNDEVSPALSQRPRPWRGCCLLTCADCPMSRIALMEEPLRRPLSSCPSRTAVGTRVTGQKLPCATALCRHPSARILTGQGQEERWT